MSERSLKLTTYFGERDRTERGRLLADELIDIYAAHELAISVLLRGAEGFGRMHHHRSDRQLTSSEDLPLVSVAVDARARIERALGDVLAVKRRGLVTLERAHLASGAAQELLARAQLGEAAKLTVYVGRGERVRGIPAHVAVCELLKRRGLAGASVLLGVDGTRMGRRERASLLARNARVPLMVIAVGAGERIAAVLPELDGMVCQSLLTLERVRVLKRDGELLASPHELPGTDEHGLALWQKLTVYSSQQARGGHGRPLHLELMHRLLRETDVAGVTVLRGVWGFHGEHAPHGDRFFQVRRRVPVATILVDRPERIARAFPIIDAITSEHGLVTSETVPAAQAMSAERTRGGLRLAVPRG